MHSLTVRAVTLGYPYGQEDTIEDHLLKAGVIPIWERGKPTEENPEGNVLKKGKIKDWDLNVVKTRSSGVPRRVSEGVFDLGVVGTDVYLDHRLPNITIVSKYNHGRKKDAGNSFLELVACQESPINTIEDIIPGTIVYTDVPHLLKEFFNEHGIKTALYWKTVPKLEFKARLTRSQRVGIEITDGGVAQHLQPDEVLGLVTESGSTRDDNGLKHIAKVCDIEALLIANDLSLIDPEKERTIGRIIKSLDRVYLIGETEGLSTLNHEGSRFQSRSGER